MGKKAFFFQKLLLVIFLDFTFLLGVSPGATFHSISESQSGARVTTAQNESPVHCEQKKILNSGEKSPSKETKNKDCHTQGSCCLTSCAVLISNSYALKQLELTPELLAVSSEKLVSWDELTFLRPPIDVGFRAFCA